MGISFHIISTKDKNKTIYNIYKEAIQALKIAKEQGENTFYIFQKKDQEELNKYIKTKNIIINLLENKPVDYEFLFYFQPIIDIKENKIIAAEILTRCKNIKEDKFISPAEFVSIIERNNYHIQFDINNIKKFIKLFNNLPQIEYFINISGKTFNDKNFYESLSQIQNQHLKFLTFEITETSIMQNKDFISNKIKELREKGIKIAIDDFGTGYSSLSHLEQLEVDYLKIDREFTLKCTNPRTDIIIQTILFLCQKLNLKTIAEGIEQQKELEYYKNLNCDYAQGFYFFKPMPLEDFLKLF